MFICSCVCGCLVEMKLSESSDRKTCSLNLSSFLILPLSSCSTLSFVSSNPCLPTRLSSANQALVFIFKRPFIPCCLPAVIQKIISPPPPHHLLSQDAASLREISSQAGRPSSASIPPPVSRPGGFSFRCMPLLPGSALYADLLPGV